MGYIMVKDPASFQTPQKLLVLVNKINKALIKKKERGVTSVTLQLSEDGEFDINLSFFNEDTTDNFYLNIYNWLSDKQASDICDFFILYLKGKKTFGEMKEFANHN